jgi:hypothetical protein
MISLDTRALLLSLSQTHLDNQFGDRNPTALFTLIADCLLRNNYSVRLIITQLEQVVTQCNVITFHLFYGSPIYRPVCLFLYRVIHKSLQDVWTLQYSSLDGYAEGEHVNRGRDTPSFFPALQVFDMSFLLYLSWLLRSRDWKFQRDLWITLYISLHIYNPSGICVWGLWISL